MFKKIKSLSLLIVMLSSTAIAQNAIYIEQVGDSSAINVTQTGNQNKIGSEQNRFELEGNAQNVNITQTGQGNVLEGRITNASNYNFNADITGDTNQVTMNAGGIASVSGTTQNLTITGSTNDVTFNQGATNSATNGLLNYTIAGDLNTLVTNIETDDVINTVNVDGDGNQITTTQNGMAGKNIDMNVIGSTNVINVNQTSTLNVDTLKINTTGSGSTININQCNGVC